MFIVDLYKMPDATSSGWFIKSQDKVPVLPLNKMLVMPAEPLSVLSRSLVWDKLFRFTTH